MKVLLVTSNLPYPPINGMKIRVWNLLQQIAERHEVTLLSLLDSPNELQFVPHLQRLCTRVETVVKQHRRPRGKLALRLTKMMLKGQPPRNGVNYYGEMATRVQEMVKSQAFDIIQIEHSAMAPYIELIGNTSNAARLISLYDVGAVQLVRILRVQSGFQDRFLTALDWFFLRHWEPSYLARHFDKCIVVSAVDESLLRHANPALDLVAVPNGVDTAKYNLLPEIPDSKEILFIGDMHYQPNVDGALFFYNEIFPLVQEQVCDAHWLIVGRSPVPEVRVLAADPAVTVTGFVDDVIPYYRRACLSVVPLRAGGGTRLKILESMALGRPVVSTRLGCEGLEVTDGENISVADDPTDLANCIVQLLNSRDLRQCIAAKGRELVETTYDWRVIASTLLQVYEELVDNNGRSTEAEKYLYV